MKYKRKVLFSNISVEWIFIFFLIMTSFMNILFITHASLTASETTVNDGLPESLITSPLYLTTPRKLTKEDYMNIATITELETRYIEIEIYSSKEIATLTLNGPKQAHKLQMLQRGLHVVVLNEVTGGVMSSMWFDTYLSKPDSARLVEYLNEMKLGRIICFATKDDAAESLSDSARSLIKSFGSFFIADLGFREMWAFVVQRFDDQLRPVVHGESAQKSQISKQWSSPVRLLTSVKLLSKHVTKCSWDDTGSNRRRRAFCDKYEGYGDVCKCDNPLSLEFNPPSLPDGTRLQLPLAVMARNQPMYLLRMLLSLRNVLGLDPELVTVHIDGFYDEPSSVAMLFGLLVEQHHGIGKRNSRKCQFYKKSLSASFDRFPDANHLVILREDLEMSSDILSYFNQLLPVLKKDESVYCISAWNYQGYDHLSNDPAMLYRVETMPGLGWVLSRKLYKNELESKWPKSGEICNWKVWIRDPSIRNDRECIVPDISRAYPFGFKGPRVGSYMQSESFEKHAVNNESYVIFDIDKMYHDSYESEMERLLSQAKVLDHSRTPCEDSVEFVPDSTGETYVFYLRMDTARDLTTWSNVARCFVMSDLNVGGNHNSMWRFWIKKNHILAVGCPASTYCVYKPKDVTPLDLPG